MKKINSLLVLRKHFTVRATQGELYINGKFFCYTLEDAVRSVKIENQTAIPEGSYNVIISTSNRFKRDMPLLLNVPNFEGIRLHGGNTHKNTSGCILVAYSKLSNTTIQETAEPELTELIKKSSLKTIISVSNYLA